MSYGDGWKSGGGAGTLAGQDITARSFTSTAASGSPAFISQAGGRFNLDAAGAHYIAYNAGSGLIDYIASPQTHRFDASVTSNVASGSDAFKALTGARWHLGAGTTDYLTSDGGTTISSAGAFVTGANHTVTGNLLTMNGSAAALFFGSAVAGSARILGNMSAANATATIPAIVVLPNNALDATDAVFGVQNAATTNLMLVDYTGNATLAGPAVTTPASGGTIVTGYNGALRRGAFKITVAFGDWTAAALTLDITLGVIPAKARVVSCIADTTIGYLLGAGTIALTVGKTAGGAEYVASHSVKTSTVTKGLADADMGTALTRAAAIQGGDMPSWSAPTNFQARLTSSSGNLSSLSAGSTDFYLVVEYFA